MTELDLGTARLTAWLTAFALVGTVLLLLLFALVFGSGFGSTPSTFAVGAGLALLAGSLWCAVAVVRPWMRRYRVVADLDRLVIEHPGFREPLVVPRALVRVVDVDPGRPGTFGRRFALADGGGEMWLATPGRDRLPRLLAQPAHRPNVAVLFHGMVQPPRRGISYQLAEPTAPSVPRRPMPGVVLRVADAEAMRRAFAAWGVLRPISTADLTAQGVPLPGSRRDHLLAGHENALVIGGAALALLMLIAMFVRAIS